MKAPFEMPARGAAGQYFELQRVDYAAPEAGGRIGGVQAGPPLWSGLWSLTDMTVARSDEWRAFFARLRGATRRFIGRDRKRPFPKAHASGFGGMTRAGGGAFDGSATAWSEAINADGDSQVTLTNLPVGLVLSQGDYIGFRWTATEASVAGLTWRAMVRVDVGGTANGAGSVTVTSEPPIPSAVPAGAVAHLDNPGCVMVMVAEQSDLEPVARRGAIRGGMLAGIQDIRS